MLYFIVPENDGSLDIDYRYLQSAYQVAEHRYAVMLLNTVPIRESWVEITESEYMFSAPVIEPAPEPVNVPNELATLQENQIILMDALATIFETLIGGV